ncbi:MAG: pyridoxamine 5'-phosphate oxidase family protein [Chitinophagales bacterium]
MGDIKNLTGQEAVEKLKELSKSASVCMFCTRVESLPFEVRPMSTLKVDERGHLWFFSADHSHKNNSIQQDTKVQLLYSQPSDSHFLAISGSASITKSRMVIDELWNDMAKAWFPEGKDDPNLTVIEVRPETAHYWDTKHGKLVTLLAIGAAAVTGKPMDGGVEGGLSV